MMVPPAQGFFHPAEWQFHQACWLAFPSHAELWGENLPSVQAEFAALCQAIAFPDPLTGQPQGEQLKILVLDAPGEATAQAMLNGLNPEFYHIPFGDIWLRDTGPIFLRNQGGQAATVRFRFNGWGEKYSLPGDAQVAENIAQAVDLPQYSFPFVLEGGAIETDGAGTCLTTRQCLLNPNRNPHLTPSEITESLNAVFGYQKVLWLDQGLEHDHTDGHIDTLVRFVRSGVVVCMESLTAEDVNAATLQQIAHDLETFTDAQGRPLEVVKIPSPGLVLDGNGTVLPASYINFYIANKTVIVPTYGSEFDQPAVKAIAQLFPERKTIGLSAKHILLGGGAFHCITQQQL
ncbi:agmatine deiminase family protein [Synechococcus sp. PCC 6312]|uniref:agmatine deiminase family protein n=1 Tax=Synechococcus sp. (strain ATCC 27167 / PCC 6312) TaxID=195253 RepID=UPI00029F47A5|nr:agmatine deiminase family protein [Synechococcus sp. PCC 6312]AFY61390.1 peptidylarginine deiminase-like enzyme [Synechococcus sp. PCC 6312]